MNNNNLEKKAPAGGSALPSARKTEKYTYDPEKVIKFRQHRDKLATPFLSDIVEPMTTWQGMPANQEGVSVRILSSVERNAKLSRCTVEDLEKVSIMAREFTDLKIDIERVTFRYCNTEVASKMTTSYAVIAEQYPLGLAARIRACIYSVYAETNTRSHIYRNGVQDINLRSVYDEAEYGLALWPDGVLSKSNKPVWSIHPSGEPPRRDQTSTYLRAYGFSLDLYHMMACDLDAPGDHLDYLCLYNFRDAVEDDVQTVDWAFGWDGEETIYETMEDYFAETDEPYGPMLVFIPHADQGHSFLISWQVAKTCTCRLPCSCIGTHYWVPGSILHIRDHDANGGWYSYGACLAKLQSLLKLGSVPAFEKSTRMVEMDDLPSDMVDNVYDASHYLARDPLIGVKRKIEHVMGFLSNKKLCTEHSTAVRRLWEQAENTPTIDPMTMRVYEQNTTQPVEAQLVAAAVPNSTTFQIYNCGVEVKMHNAVNLIPRHLAKRPMTAKAVLNNQQRHSTERMHLMQRELQKMTESFAVRSALHHCGFYAARLPATFDAHHCVSCDFAPIRRYIFGVKAVPTTLTQDPEILRRLFRKRMPELLECDMAENMDAICLAYGASRELLKLAIMPDEPVEDDEFLDESMIAGALVALAPEGRGAMLSEITYSHLLFGRGMPRECLNDSFTTEEKNDSLNQVWYVFLGDEEGGSVFHFHLEATFRATEDDRIWIRIVPSSVLLLQHFGSSEALARAWNKMQHMINGNIRVVSPRALRAPLTRIMLAYLGGFTVVMFILVDMRYHPLDLMFLGAMLLAPLFFLTLESQQRTYDALRVHRMVLGVLAPSYRPMDRFYLPLEEVLDRVPILEGDQALAPVDFESWDQEPLGITTEEVAALMEVYLARDHTASSHYLTM